MRDETRGTAHQALACGGEKQFGGEDAQRTQTTANLRIHIERALEALKEWRIIHTKLTTKQFGLGSSLISGLRFTGLPYTQDVRKRPVLRL